MKTRFTFNPPSLSDGDMVWMLVHNQDGSVDFEYYETEREAIEAGEEYMGDSEKGDTLYVAKITRQLRCEYR